MQLLDEIVVRHRGADRRVGLYGGDLSAIPAAEAVDVLVVSAFPDNYSPSRGTLIRALHDRGVSVEKLSQDKEVDLRRFSSCWLSKPVPVGHHFGRVLCFEPHVRGRPPEVVGDIFRSVVPFAGGNPPVSSVALPLVASGRLGESPAEMLDALTEAAVHWLGAGLPLDRIKVVVLPSADVAGLRATFAAVKARVSPAAPEPPADPFRFDAFVSYSWKNREAVDKLVAGLLDHRPGLRLFVDRLELQPGHAWQQHLFEAVDRSRRVVCVLSPDYLLSKMCQEEYGLATFRHREEGDVLLPVYLHTAPLPTVMKVQQYVDAREGDPDRLRAAAAEIARRL